MFGSFRIRSSIENLVDGPDIEPLVTFPDGDTPSEELHMDLTPLRPGDMVLSNGQLKSTGDTVKFEETRTVSASRNHIITDGYISESVSLLVYVFTKYSNASIYLKL